MDQSTSLVRGKETAVEMIEPARTHPLGGGLTPAPHRGEQPPTPAPSPRVTRSMTQLQSTATKQDVYQQALQDTASMEPEQRQARILELLENGEDPDYYIRMQQETVAAEDSDTTAFAYRAAGEEPNSYWQVVKGHGGSF